MTTSYDAIAMNNRPATGAGTKFPAGANLLDHIERMIRVRGGGESCQTVELRRKGNSPVDVRIFFRGKEWLTTPAAEEFLSDLAGDAAVAGTRRKGPAISIRFTDDFIDELGGMLESGDTATLDPPEVLAGQCYAVGFAGPNTSKALHIGHLRNITIGSALASALAAAGADVIRQSLVGDIGRNICEAMAGLAIFHPDGIPADVKPDRLIGECYARYIRESSGGAASDGNSDDPAMRETMVSNDLADIYMRQLLAGDPDVRSFWRRTRDMVLDGHRQTLERFGIVIDRCDYESDAMEDIPALMEHGLRSGILRREDDGTVIYESGRAEFETMVLVRNDGFPTEHARLLGVYYRMFAEWRSGRRYIDLSGTEWQPASALHTELLQRLRPELMFGTHILLFHGMVMLRNMKMSSSEGGAPLIDDLLEQLGRVPEIRLLADSSGGTVDAGAVANILVKSFFLCRPHIKPMEFSWDLLLQEDNPGWAIARTWCMVQRPEDGEGTFDPESYRLAVIRSQDFCRNLAGVAESLSLAGPASYLLHFCEDILASSSFDPRLRGVARTVLRRGMRSLGLAGDDR